MQHGLETVEFQVAANQGTPLRSLAKVASGGELSRISLAIQVAASRAATVPTLIFDEVDSGIGGRVAEIVGSLLKQLGKRHQVMCVTHLPQVAAQADAQWQVSKAAHAGKTLSNIRVLDRAERIEEIARMLGGVKITETTRKHAAELLGVAWLEVSCRLFCENLTSKCVSSSRSRFRRCSLHAALLPTFTPYKVEIRQGNLITPDMRAKIKVGMTQSQVKAALGAPLINDPYHANRWDYIYRLETQRRIAGEPAPDAVFQQGQAGAHRRCARR